jgi:Predicted Zn-dependent hydrolases of the beta-lactamase fold
MDRVYKFGDELLKEIRETNLPDGFVSVWYLGQSSMLVKYLDKYFIFDPHLEDSLSKRLVNPSIRNYPSPIDPALCDFLDYVFISHNHADHLEAATIEKLARCNDKVKFIIPAPVKAALTSIGVEESRIIAAHSNIVASIGGLSFVTIPAAHYELNIDENGDAPAVGYIVKCGNLSVYHAGDTIVYPGMVEKLKEHKINIAMIPINGRDYRRDARNCIGNTTFREAADLCSDIYGDLLIPMHYDLYDHNTENPAFLTDYLYSRHRGMKYHLFQPGERFIYSI